MGLGPFFICFPPDNPCPVGLKKTLQKGIVHISRGFNLYNKFQETENIASRGVSILINNNFKKTYQNVVALNINLQTAKLSLQYRPSHKSLPKHPTHDAG